LGISPFFATEKGIYLRYSSLDGGLIPVRPRDSNHFVHGGISRTAWGLLSLPQPLGTRAAHTEVLRALQEGC